MTNDGLTMDNEGNLLRKIRLIILTTFIGLLSIAVSFWLELGHQERDETLTNYLGPLILEKFQHRVDSEASEIDEIKNKIISSDLFKKSFLAKDRSALLEASRQFFHHLKENDDITHLYFTDTDRVNFLRVHDPSRYGDRIDRFTTLEAERTGKLIYGIELGPLGTITLRVVHPWFDQGKLIGYVEFGMEIYKFFDKIMDDLDTKILVTLNKKFLDQKSAEKWAISQGNPLVWGRYDDMVLVGDDINTEELDTFLTKTHHDNAIFEIDNGIYFFKNHRHYFSQPLIELGGREIGKVIGIYTDSNTENERRVTAFTFLGVFSLLFGIFYCLILRIFFS